MKTPTLCDVNERPSYKFKKHPYIPLEDEFSSAFSKVTSRVLHVEDICAYITASLRKWETITFTMT